MAQAGAVKFALNHMAAPGLGVADFIDLAVRTGCDGIELRNDLPGVDTFAGNAAPDIRSLAERRNIQILSINALQRFNDWTEERRQQAIELTALARACGAATIVMCPVNSPDDRPGPQERQRRLRTALAGLGPILSDAGVTGLVEPLGFEISSLRSKREAVEAIADVGAERVFRLVHDTFHHHLAGEPELFPAQTGLVHISGVVEKKTKTADLRDGGRVLVGADDRLGSAGQVAALVNAGYRGYVSFEPFAASIQALADPAPMLLESIDFVRREIDASPA